jgi:FKBP-type peptidyl-prolyl cis-trans isomerase
MEVDVAHEPSRSFERPLRSGIRRTALAACVVAVLILVAGLALSGCASPTQSAQTAQSAQTQPAQQPSTPPAAAPSVTKLQIKDVKVGKGAAAKSGDNVTVNYTGWLEDGTKFDSSIGRAPFAFQLGAGVVIPGWDQGVVGMKVGGKRILVIPPDLGYGAQGSPPVIPANAVLKFEVDMLTINK